MITSFFAFYIAYGLVIKIYVHDPLKLVIKGIETRYVTSKKLLNIRNDAFGYLVNLFKTDILENLTHEIRTPMNAIIGFPDLLVAGDLDDNEKIEYLQIINKSGQNFQ